MKEIAICSSWFSSFDFRIIGCCHDWFGRKWHPLNYRLEVNRFPYTAFRTKSIRYEIPLCFEYQSQPFIGSRLQAIARFPYGIPLYSTKLSCILTLRQTIQLHIVNVYFNFIVLILSIKSYPDFVDQFIPQTSGPINRRELFSLISAPILRLGYSPGRPEMPFDGHFDAF